VRRQTAPTHRAGQAKLIEPLRIVVHNAAGEDLPLPGIGGNLKSLQLLENFQRAAFPDNLRSRREDAATVEASA